MGHIFRNEYLESERDKLTSFSESFYERLTMLEKLGEIKIVSNFHIQRLHQQKENCFSLINHFGSMGQSMVDTYLIVLIAVQEMCNNNFVVIKDNLVGELHNEIKYMHSLGLLQQLQSCNKETIGTALDRFVKLKHLEDKSYPTKKGTKVSYLQSPFDKKKIQVVLQ